MTPFHSLFPELAQREVRCVHLGSEPDSDLPADEYACVEFYCEDLNCDCRRVFLQVIAKGQPGKVLASIGYGAHFGLGLFVPAAPAAKSQ